ncbi:MAG: hypothetical protein FWE71_02460 [Nocardioidaceae bacterium]|nr:hypothetical protein [Nocardioidaceae bacterium]MCL2611649.1 hypothetical protein [Nocardioidaceae bacterium]
MALPEDPPTFRQPTPAERPWWWRLQDASGAEVTLPADLGEYDGQRFANQGDAESWIGEVWSELAEGGVTQVTLVEVDRDVYGPMSLSAE